MIPKNIQKALELFSDLNYVLFKCEHILQGSNKNVDLLLSDDDYEQAANILEGSGFVFYMPESIEKYKKMYVRYDYSKENFVLTAIHLHREVAWHGVIALTKKPILERSQQHLPSAEDALLIHSAHALFENFKITAFQRSLLEEYKKKATDNDYINKQLQENGWKKEFYEFNNRFLISKSTILSVYLKSFRKRPVGVVMLSTKAAKALLRFFSVRRKGYLIALIGMNGTGKTTLQQEILKQYQPLTKFVSGQQGYYFGWKPALFSRIVAKSSGERKIFEKVTPEKTKRFDLFQECLFGYIYLEYLWRYYKNIYSHLRKNHLVVSDRYFYDLYGQYPYSKNSIILPFLYFPKPNATFVLDADVDTVMKRDKTGKEERKVQPKEKLLGQKQRYLALAQQQKTTVLDTQDSLERNKQMVISNTWRSFLRP